MKIVTITSYLFLLLVVAREVSSQSAPLWKQPAHVFPQKLSWWDSIYQFPHFQEGRIIFVTGFSLEQTIKVNYNLYYGFKVVRGVNHTRMGAGAVTRRSNCS